MNDSRHRRDDDAETDGDEPFEPAVEQDPEPRTINWQQIGESMSAMRDAIVNLALLCFFTALFGVVVLELFQKAVVIEPIRMPGPLAEVGYTEDVAAQRLTDAIAQVREAAPTALQGVNWMPASQQVDFEAPETGITLRNVVQVLRQAMKLPETRIAGEFICASPECAQDALTLRLRVMTRDGMKVIKLEKVGTKPLSDYYRDAALELLRELDPYLVAAYLYVNDKTAAEHEALRILGPKNPQRKWAMNLLGYMAAERKDYDTAIDWYSRAAKADENDRFAIAYANWGNALLAQGKLPGQDKVDQGKVDQGKVDEAIAMQKRAIDIDPEFAFAYLSLAEALAAKGEHAQAMENIALAAELDPPSAYTFNVWGNAYYKQYEKSQKREDLDAAIEKFRQATEIDPKNTLALFNWGIALDAKGDKRSTGEAIRKYERAIELDENYVDANVNLGIDLRKLGQYDAAIERFQHVIGIDPRNAPALYNLGRARADQEGGLPEALGLFERAAQFAPDDSDIFLHWGISLVKLTRVGDGLEKLRHAVKLNPKNSMAYLSLGSILRLMNQKVEAAEALDSYLKLEPTARNAATIEKQVKELRGEESGG